MFLTLHVQIETTATVKLVAKLPRKTTLHPASSWSGQRSYC